MSAKIEIEKYDRNVNFGLWQVKMRAVLVQQGVSKALKGKQSLPDTMTEEDKEDMDEKALTSIQLCLSNEVLREVVHEKTATDLWQKLETLYLTKTLANRLHLKQRLFMLRMSEGTSIKSHVDVFNSILMDLENLDIKVEDEDQALLLLCSLPPSYKHFRETLIYGRDEITMDDVKSSLFSKDLLDKELTHPSTSKENVEALYARGRKMDRNSNSKTSDRRSKSKGKVKTCFYCKKRGHTIDECRKLQRKENNNSKTKADVAESSCVEVECSDIGYVFVASSSYRSRDDWILDSGCTHHMTPNRDLFSTYKSVEGGVVLMGNDSQSETIGIGTVDLRMHDGTKVTLTEVKHVPDLTKNLISLPKLDEKGCRYGGENGIMTITKDGKFVMSARKSGDLYLLQGSTVTSTAAVATTSSSKLDRSKLWHMRLGHLSEKGMTILNKKGLIDVQNNAKLDFCEHCILGKQKRVSFGLAEHRTYGTVDYIHSDLWGPSQVTSKGGARYMLTFIDDFSRKVWVYTIKSKDEVFSYFKQWKALIEKQTGKKVKRLRTDNGLEFCSSAFNDFCKNEGIVRHRTVRHTPQQNGVAERMNRTILERTRCMLMNANLSKDFWAEAVSTAAYLINRSPSSAINNKSPEEVWSGHSPNYSHLRIFGCTAYAHVSQGKLEPRSQKCIFLGYASGVKGYRLWSLDPKSPKVIIEKNVIFHESAMFSSNEVAENSTDTATHVDTDKQVELELDFDPLVETSADSAHVSDEIETDILPEVEDCIALRRERRVITPPSRYAESAFVYALSAAEETTDAGEPSTFSEAMSSPRSPEWSLAMNEEMESLSKNQTWILVPHPKRQKIVGCKWIFKRKEDSSGTARARYKARLVAKGFSQVEGIDYTEIFSPVVKHTSIRILLAIVALNNLELEQLDVKTAFLHGNLEEQIYMQQPEGFVVEGKEDHVCLLKKSLYGLKQSPRQWYKKFNSFMIAQGFYRSKYDVCVYFKIDAKEIIIFLLLYVDDMLIAARNKSDIDQLKVLLGQHFEMKDLGAAKKILGMEIYRNRQAGKLYLSQKSYILKVLERFGMSNAKHEKVPLAAHFKLSSKQCPNSEDESEYMSQIPYSSAVGSLMYAMICTRPDISYAVSVVSRFMANPGKEHWRAVKWILRYLQGTVGLSLQFGRSRNDLTGYVDADYGGDRDCRRSMTGYIFTVGKCAISWKASLQHSVALSTTEAEYMAAAEGIKEALWLKGLFAEFSPNQKVIEVYCDSQSAIHLAKDQLHHERTKHIDIRYHFIRDIILQGSVTMKKIPTTDNPADMMTKSLPLTKFTHCTNLVGLCGL